MVIPELKNLQTEQSILFLGSGFSRTAINIRGQSVPMGNELKQELADTLCVNPNDYDFQTIAEEIHGKDQFNLYQLLYELFTVAELKEDHINILHKPWRRIYTTNYDDAIELYHHQTGKNILSFSYTDPIPRRIPFGSVIHLHGTIRLTNENNILDQIVLTESSYVRQHFEKSLWYDEFVRDLRFCQYCIFVGYSLSDYHISSILLQHREITRKTYFITGESVDAIFSNRIAPYGELLPVGLESFSEHCKHLIPSMETGSIYNLKSFQYLDPLKDKRSLSKPTALEILNLVTYGTFNFQRCFSTLPESEYVIARPEKTDEAANLIDGKRTLIVHSLLGNGKSIFLYILAHKLSERGYRYFMAKANAELLAEDVELLKDIEKIVLMFDEYNPAVGLISEIEQQLPSAKIVVAVRSGIQDVRLHEIQARFPSPMQRLSLNEVSRYDLAEFRNLLNQSGVRSKNFERDIARCRNFREVVTLLYNHAGIREKIGNALRPLMEDREVRRVVVASHLLRWAGHEADVGFLRSVTGSDSYAVMKRHHAIAADLFRLGDDEVHVRSSVFSEYLIQNHLTADDILDGVYPIIVEAVKRKVQRRYQGVLGTLMQFSKLSQALINESDKIDLLVGLYERLRRDEGVNAEPLFWLQYSILMTAADRLNVAEDLIRTAYSRAEDNPGFVTFQIDTFALRLMLLIEQRAMEGERVDRFENILEKMEEVRRMIGEESRRDHAIQVMRGIEPFVESRLSALDVTDRTKLVYHLALVQNELERLTIEERARTGSVSVHESVGRARQLILTASPKTVWN